MGSVVFSDSYSTSIAGYATYDVRISYSESYSISTNKSTIEITDVELRKQGNGVNWGSLPFFGDIKVNGTTLISMDGGSSVRVSLSGDGYCSVAIPSSGSVDVSHNSDGTGSFTMQLVGGFSYSGDDYFCALYQGSPSQPFGVAETSKSVSLTTRPRASSVSVSNGYFGSNVPITISRHASSFTHTVKVSCAGYSQTLMTKGSTYPTVNWTPAVATYAPRITTAMSVRATVTCETYSGSTLVGTSTATCTLTLRAADVAPAVSIATADPQGYLSTYGRYVKSKSKIKVTLTNTLRYGATLALTQITANGATYNSSPATTGVIASASNTSVTAKITDSRGQTATASATIAIYDYTSPQINSFSVHRCNSDGTLNNSGAYMRVDYKVTVTALGNNNSKTLTLKYKKVSASSYTSQAITLSAYTQTGEVHNITADVNSSYNVQLVLSDDFTSATSTLTLPTASTRINWKSGENGGIAFGKVCEYDKTFEIADDWYLRYNNYIPLNNVVNKIPENADLNDYDLPGVYAVDTYNNAITITNIPSQNAGTLRVFASTGRAIIASSTWKYLIQEYITIFGKRYYRYGGSESGTAVTWDAWRTVYDSSDFPLSVTRGAADNYTPVFAYSDSGATLTVGNIAAKYFLFGGHVCVVSMRFNITNLGTHTNKENLQISLPNNVTPTLNTVAPVGVYYTSGGVSNLVIRTNTSGVLDIVDGIGGNYSAGVITTGFQGLFAVIVF